MSATPSPAAGRLRYFAISWFAVVMGIGGGAVAWNKAEKVFGIGLPVGMLLGYFALAAFAAIAVIYGIKAARHPQAVKAEFSHPVRLSFFPAVSISLILLAVVFQETQPLFSRVLWSIGAPVQLLLAVHVISAWIRHDIFQVQHSNPAWFIPVVGNVLVPIAGVAYAPLALSWFFFSIGIFFWLALFGIIFNRMIFHGMLPERLMPTLFILIAPPAVSFIAYLRMIGEVDAFAHILYHIALFFTLLVLAQGRLFAKLGFYLSWWACSFPIAAVTVATLLYYERLGGAFFAGLSIALLALLSGLLIMLVVRTALGIAGGTICVEE
ncbi:MAG: SLAC1 anion channel family protein [Rhodospirillales bacterium]|nr:SLAC1 anion channel family protein [Rhodospirillales bacterium]